MVPNFPWSVEGKAHSAQEDFGTLDLAPYFWPKIRKAAGSQVAPTSG
jgi:hypothetical protein